MKLPKAYEPAEYERDIYALWEQSGVFAPSKHGEPFSVVMPPPNANANLHIGYELTAAIEDTVVRYQRLRGKSALLLPGADHAGFETQSVYEKHLAKQGKSRFDFSREQLYADIWDFVASNRGNFEKQMRQMGVSCDWSKFSFTLDEKIVKRAYATFKKMWDEGLIYRSERLVNYCTHHRTGFADIEVVYEQVKTPLYYIKYGPFTLATTRPETKFGDTAVAVHPDDERYKDWVGKTVTVEGVNGPFEVRVVADDMVDPAFGTGAVKITPAHSFDDWEVAQRHNLPPKRVIDHDGTMNHLAGRFQGLTVLEAREAVAKAMQEQGLLEKVDKDYQTRIGKCYKCGTAIEPMLMKQWFINMEPLAQPAIQALEQGKVKFYPEAKGQQLIGYLRGLHDWNISRQIAWGIPIPAFQNVNDEDDWIYDERVDQEIIEVDGKTYHRDPDVFDTWFSSSSWPYATLDYPDGDDFKKFYPLSLMETGGEILYPWVSRMLMLGLYVTGEVPFRDVYIHGYVMAEDGAKMSKSLGNVVDPLPVIEQYGSDALRMGILAGRVAAVNRGYDSRKVEDARNFCNKLWNIARFIEGVLGDNFKPSKAKADSLADDWVMNKLQHTQKMVENYMAGYQLSEAYDALYHFIWDDLADWYIEASKLEPNKPLLAELLESTLIMLHPFAPFVTETIWQTLAWEKDSILASRPWPKLPKADQGRATQFDELKGIITETRFIPKSLGASQITLYYNKDALLTDNAKLIARLAGLKAVTEVKSGTGLFLTSTDRRCWLDIDSDTASHYRVQLEKDQAEAQKRIQQLEKRLNNENYVSQAPKHLVDETRQQLADAKSHFEKLVHEADRFNI